MAIGALDNSIANIPTDDLRERGIGVFNDSNGLTTRDQVLMGNDTSVNVGSFLADPSVKIVGHIHQVNHPSNEVFSRGDRSVFLRENPNKAQFLLRSPSGAIRSIKRGSDGFIRETLRGSAIRRFPRR